MVRVVWLRWITPPPAGAIACRPIAALRNAQPDRQKLASCCRVRIKKDASYSAAAVVVTEYMK